MKIGIPKEIHAHEARVALTPETAGRLHKLGFTTCIEAGAGALANFTDDAYREAGVEVVDDAKQIWADSDLILKVRAPQDHEVDLLPDNGKLISFFWPAQNEALLNKLSAKKATVMAMDCVPRISRAQKCDALSSMANIGGYRAVIEAANRFGSFFTGQITAAGKVPPAKFLVIGAGVAGLSAIATAAAMGAIVRAFDTRPEVKEQVESMGGEFLLLDFDEDGSGSGGYAKTMSPEFIEKEMELFAQQAQEVDVIITTALIPGRPAPELITAAMVESMKPGSVIVDLASEQGGNCALTEPGKVVVKHGVTLIGYTDLPSRLPTQASQLYATNLRHLLTDLTPEKDGQINVNMDDAIIRGVTIIKEGEITWPPPAIKMPVQPKKSQAESSIKIKADAEPPSTTGPYIAMVLGTLALLGVGSIAPPDFIQHFTVFVLACFIGYMVVWNVTPALHTPLMSVTNAISGIIVIGALLQVSQDSLIIKGLAGVAILIAAINVGGGFLVTQRMLKMFEK